MNYALVHLSRVTGLGLTELREWDPRSLVTLEDILDEEAAARRRANRR